MDASCGLEDDLELFLDVLCVLGVHFFDGDLAGFPED